MAVYRIKTILGHEFGATEEELKWCYHSWADGAINIDREEKPMYYFTHYVLSDISFTEFSRIILGGNEYDKNDL
jgi:hypothetical protein